MRLTRTIWLFCLLSTVVVAGCPKGALVLSRDAAASNLAFERAVTIAHHDDPAMVDDATERTLLGISKKVAIADDSVVTLLQKNDKQGAIVQIDNAIAAIDDGLANGLLGVKNQTKQVEFRSLLLAIRGTLVNAKAFAS